MNDLKFVSEEYSIHNTKNYRLSIQINPDGFSVLMLSGEKKPVKLLHIQTDSIENTFKLFKKEEYLIELRELSFRSVSLFINNEKVGLIPGYEEYSERIENYFNIDFGKSTGSSLRMLPLENQDIICSFGISKQMEEFISSFRNNPRVKHICADIIYKNLDQGKSSNRPYLLCYSTPGLLHMSLVNSGNLEFYNAYTWNTEDEMLFHLINTLRKLVYDEILIEYGGHLRKTGNTMNLMKKYLPGMTISPNVFSFGIAWDVHENYFTYLHQTSHENYQR